MPEPGWYHDPARCGRLRLWDGSQWRDQTRPCPRESAGTGVDDRRAWLQGCAAVSGLIVIVLAIVTFPGRPGGLAFADPPLVANDIAVRQTDPVATAAGSSTTLSPPATAAVTVQETPSRSPSPSSVLRVAPPPVTPPQATPPPRPTGVASDADVEAVASGNFSLTGYRWDPCQPITVSTSGPDVGGVVAELASITGLRLQLVAAPADIEVSWGSAPVGDALGETYLTTRGPNLVHVVVTLAHRAEPYLATVVRHELGHALGLGHAPRPGEVMFALVQAGAPRDYQAGDVSGLRAVSASGARC